jgi:predicted dehydrogenase
MSDSLPVSGMSYAPQGKPNPVCGKGDFPFAVIGLDHGHIYGQTNGLIEAGGELRFVYDPDPKKVTAFQKRYPSVRVAGSEAEILDDSSIKMVAAAVVPCDRCALGLRVLDAGMDYFTDKCPFTTLDQLQSARVKTAQTGRRYMVYFSERLHVECAVFAGDLIEQGAIGRVLQVIGLGPHRLGVPTERPGWFYEKARYGGILCDIASHQCEQFLFYAGAKDATVSFARVANYCYPEYPEMEDFGEAAFLGDNGVSNYQRIDWLTPLGLGTWGDGRTIILGSDGYIELRKYINVATDKTGDHLFLVNGQVERHFELHGQVGFPFFGRLILDSLNRTETAMTQEHAFKAAELSLKAQAVADAARSAA